MDSALVYACYFLFLHLHYVLDQYKHAIANAVLTLLHLNAFNQQMLEV